jgi:hypothetical protein
MSIGTQPQTFADLYTLLLSRLREQSAAATVLQAKGAINVGLQDMHIGFGEKFTWAERSARLTTQPAYSTGTISITQGSTTLTGVSTAWTTQNAFGVNNVRSTGKIVINGTLPVYEIASVDSSTGITLASRYVGDDVSAGTYLYYEDEYDLHADFLRPMDLHSFDTGGTIDIIGRQRFRSQYVRVNVTGKPVVACIVDRAPIENTLPVRRVQFWKPPDIAYSIPYNFVTSKLAITAGGVAAGSLINDTDEPIVPLSYRHAIVFHALYHWYRDKKDDSRSQEAKAEFTDLVLRIAGDTEIGESRPSLQPRMGGYRRQARSPYRVAGSGRRHTLGTRFDEMKNDY